MVSKKFSRSSIMLIITLSTSMMAASDEISSDFVEKRILSSEFDGKKEPYREVSYRTVPLMLENGICLVQERLSIEKWFNGNWTEDRYIDSSSIYFRDMSQKNWSVCPERFSNIYVRFDGLDFGKVRIAIDYVSKLEANGGLCKLANSLASEKCIEKYLVSRISLARKTKSERVSMYVSTSEGRELSLEFDSNCSDLCDVKLFNVIPQ